MPCRVIDTRKIGNGQPFSGTLSPPVDVVDSVCGPPATAQAYVFNATVVPSGGLGYLTLWPDGQSQPVVSTLNAIDGAITSNMAIVPTSNGKVDAYAVGNHATDSGHLQLLCAVGAGPRAEESEPVLTGGTGSPSEILGRERAGYDTAKIPLDLRLGLGQAGCFKDINRQNYGILGARFP